MAKEGGLDWDGLLKWSLANSDGTQPARQLTDEDRRWFMEAMQAQTVDVVRRMKEITLVMSTPDDVLQSQGVTPDDIHNMLDELHEHVESIDMANDLHSVGGLVPLLGYLRSPHANLRAKAADVVSTIVQNNPKSQQLVMEANGLDPLLTNFNSDSSIASRTKALGAISSLIQHNKPGITAFRLANGYAALKDALSSDDVRFQRKALNLIKYLLHENSADCSIVTELGIPRQMVNLASSADSDVREAALGGLLELAKDKKSGALADEEKLKSVLQSRIDGICEMSQDQLEAAREERQLVDSLWKECYDEPSSLREKGLVVLPGEETFTQPPDVAGKFFEPALRAWSTPKQDGSQISESADDKKDAPPPLLLGPGPSYGSSGSQNNGA
ncbi:hypothetical protein LUZ63_017250 [Rhynchospora breviuscula]|uniref:TOG domain-containing protein n=1 Tax=Rhynchospora breviuscula TaxID=2022672 RepID=A0A9Q0HGQ1_9POAL|nr:hypothetical protein LUZ63_017250 [Rhynchospora breviuscula]